MSLPTEPLVANAIRLIRANKELGAHLLAMKHGTVSHEMQHAQTCDHQRFQREAQLAQAELIVRSGSDSWSLTNLGQQVSTYLVQYEADEELALMYGRLEFPADAIFLDLGCGAGPALVNACQLSTSPQLLIGIDIDRPSLIAADAFLGAHHSRCLLVQADLAALPIKSEVISHVCSRLSLPYVSQHVSMAELGRVLAPGGKAFLQLHGLWFYLRLLRDEFGNWKRVVANAFCLLNGFLFSLLGIQLRVCRPTGVYQELYQTLGGITRLLKRHRIDVLWHENAKLFRVFGRKQRA
jgi:SAM-dependent methyltransferase